MRRIYKAGNLAWITLCALSLLIAIGSNAAAALPPVSAPTVPGPFTDLPAYNLHLKNLLGRLSRAGLREIRGAAGKPVALRHFRREVMSLHFIYTRDFSKPSGATRWSAFNDPRAKRIYINAGADVSLEAVETLALHEALGALGYSDEDYRHSILMRLYLSVAESNLVGDEARGPLLDALAAMLLESAVNFIPTDAREQLVRDANSRLKRGGADVVGSGGDGAALLYKVRLIEDLLGPLGLPSLATLPLLSRAVDLSVELFEEGLEPEGGGAWIFPDTMTVYLPRRLASPRGERDKVLATREYHRIYDFLLSAGSL